MTESTVSRGGTLLERILGWSLQHRLLVLGLAIAFVLLAAMAVRRLDIDAFPDTTPVQVQINAGAPALAPEQIERLVTTPIEHALGGLPSLVSVRSVSKFGLSQIVVTFADGVDIWFARRVVGERLATVSLPPGIATPKLGPVTSGLGEVLHYVVTAQSSDPTLARTVQDWIIRPALRAVPGVAEINSWGGFEKQYQIRLDPDRLVVRGLTFDQVIHAVEANNSIAGGGSISAGGSMLLVQGSGAVTGLAEIEQIVIATRDGIPIRVRDVASVEVGAEIRRGMATYQGAGEAVLGLGFMLMGENPHTVTSRLKAKLAEIEKTLPEGVRVHTVYDRTDLVDQIVSTLERNLFEGGLLVIAVLFVFLGNLRAGLIVASAIPLSMLAAFCGMLSWGIAGSLMSLGALDFGLLVDGAVIQVENVMRTAARERNKRPFVEVVRAAVLEVRKPTLFGELIIALVYVPILTLEGVEGKLFRPMALTVLLALCGSMVLSMTVVPALSSLLLRKSTMQEEPRVVRLAKWLYRPVLHGAMRHRLAVLGVATAALGLGVIVARGLGSEFIPRLSEGALAINVVRVAGTDLSESARYNTRMEQVLLAAFPDEMEHVWTRCGSAEVATDPMGVELSDMFMTLRPRDQWKRARSQAELTALVRHELRDLPGQKLLFTQPIELRLNEMVAGVRGDVAVKLHGDDFEVLLRKAEEVARVLSTVPGATDLATEQITGQPVLQIRADQEALARHGVSAKEVMNFVEALGSKPVGEVVEGQLRFPLVVRLPERLRESPEAIASSVVTTETGQRTPLGALARIERVLGPSTITHEWGQRVVVVQCNVSGRDVGSFVEEAQRAVTANVAFPTGRYRIEWGGQFEHLIRARTRLMIVVPAVLALIALLLFVTYRSVRDALRVFTGVPFAAVGGVLALWWRDMPFSISAAVGFIALSGVAVLGDMVLVSCVRQLRADGVPLEAAVESACLSRLRPVLMTTLVAALGFLPMALSTGVGAEVQRPLATVVIGGLVSSTLLTLLVLPAVYLLFASRSRGMTPR